MVKKPQYSMMLRFFLLSDTKSVPPTKIPKFSLVEKVDGAQLLWKQKSGNIY